MDYEFPSLIALARDGLRPALDAGVTSEWFLDSEARRCWEWMHRYRVRHGQDPSFPAVRRHFAHLDLDDHGEPAEALVEGLREHYRERVLLDGLRAAAEVYDSDGSADEAAAILREVVAEVSITRAASYDEVLSESLPEFMQMLLTEEEAMRGIPTGFTTLDRATGGLFPEQLVVLAGLPKAGKSSALLVMSMTAAKAGHRTLFVGFEMSAQEQRQRITSLLTGVSLTRILQRTLTDADRKRITRFMEDGLEEWLANFVASTDITASSTVDGIMAKVEEHEADVVYVDGSYLLDDQAGEDRMGWRALTNITQGLKRIAQRHKITVVCTTQALESKTSAKTGLATGSIGFSSSFAQDADLLLGIERPADEQVAAWGRTMKILDGRNCGRERWDIMVDWDSGFFGETEMSNRPGWGSPGWGSDDDDE